MRYLVYLLAIVLMALSPIGVHAEEINEITLTVSSDGPTKDEAVKNALRLAIEQAYGAFVSANTTIFNDELVKDEIVTITHGAIKEFKEVAAAQLSDNRYSITVQATVSLPNLITYARNHGSECEFAGNTFAMELKLFELEKENERKALYNLIPIIEQICKNTMHWELEISEPYIPKMRKDLYRDEDRFEFKDYFLNISQTGNVILDKNKYPKIYEFFNEVAENPTEFCGIDIKIWWLPKGERIEFAEIAKDYLREMSMDRGSYYALLGKGYDLGQLMDRDSNFEETDIYKPYDYYSHLDQKTLDEWYQILMDKILDIRYSFKITDANGNVSNFYPNDLRMLKREEDVVDKGNYQMWKCDGWGNVLFGGSGLFNPLTIGKIYESQVFHNPFTESVDVDRSGGEIYWSGSYDRPRSLQRGDPGWNMSVIVPMKEAQKFTSFKIQSKN